MHKYKLKTNFEVLNPPIEAKTEEADKLLESGHMMGDAIFMASLIYPEDGSLSTFFHSVDGRNNGEQLTDKEWFKVWSLLAKRLSASQTLDEGRKQLCGEVFEVIVAALTRG